MLRRCLLVIWVLLMAAEAHATILEITAGSVNTNLEGRFIGYNFGGPTLDRPPLPGGFVVFGALITPAPLSVCSAFAPCNVDFNAPDSPFTIAVDGFGTCGARSTSGS